MATAAAMDYRGVMMPITHNHGYLIGLIAMLVMAGDAVTAHVGRGASMACICAIATSLASSQLVLRASRVDMSI